MNLRKCCNHPYLFDGAEPKFDGIFEVGEHLVENSGKMVVLDKLLAKLKQDGEKVLLFTQMTNMMDIIQDYLHYRNYSYQRLDGSVRAEERYMSIKNFTEEDTFVFLLSTRAGGVGLNLTAASTVIFFDSDWNPQLDLQAQARAHRIGQTKEVRVFRLLSSFTVEELMFKRAIKKLKLKQQVLDEGNFTFDDVAKPENMGELLKFGVKNLLENEESTIEDADIEQIFSNGMLKCSKYSHISRTN